MPGFVPAMCRASYSSITSSSETGIHRDQDMNLMRGLFGNKAADEQAGDEIDEDQPRARRSQDFDPALEALFDRANQVRVQNGLGETQDATVAAQIVLTSIAMEVLCVADRRLHPDVLDAQDAGLAWAYVCFMGVRIIAIVDGQEDFDHQAFVLAVAFAVFQFYGDAVAIQIVHAGTGLFHRIVTEKQDSPEFVELNDQVHKLILAYVSAGRRDAIEALQERFRLFAELAT